MEIEPDFVSGKGWYVELSELFQVHGRKLRVDEDRCVTGHRQIRAGDLLTRQVLMEADLDRQCTVARPCLFDHTIGVE